MLLIGIEQSGNSTEKHLLLLSKVLIQVQGLPHFLKILVLHHHGSLGAEQSEVDAEGERSPIAISR